MVLARKTINDQAIFMADHVLQSAFTHETVTRFRPVNSVTEVLVISGHGLRDGLRSPASSEEMANRFLTNTDLCERAIQIGVIVDPTRFLGRT